MRKQWSLYRNSLSLLSGLGVGAGLMYLLDPDAGRRRRRNLAHAAENRYEQTARNWKSTTSNLLENTQKLRRRLTPPSRLIQPGWSRQLAALLPGGLINRRSRIGRRMRQSAANMIQRARHTAYNWMPQRLAPTSPFRGRTQQPRVLPALGYATLGALITFLFDPHAGRRRRSLMRDKWLSLWRHTGDQFGDIGRYVRGQIHGLLAVLRRPFHGHADVPDAKLVARVRSVLGRACSHPHAIHVEADQGRVLLRGLILTDELPRVISRIQRTRGVKDIINHLESHNNPENIPSLQGRGLRSGRRFDLMQAHWSPTTRLAVGGAAAAMTAYGLARRDLPGAAMTLIGAALFTRAATNLPLKRITGIHAGRRAIDVQKTININAPIEEVFGFLINYENFPHFMHNIREVRDLGNGRSHWVVAGPAGLPVEWNSILTDYAPNQIIAWKSEPGSIVAHAGVVSFQRNDDGGTRVDIKMSYNPPAGAIGHTLATLFGADPKHELDQDLLRVKTLLETGNPAHDAARPLYELRGR